jgi:RNA polymerase sigma factor (TIGR02999 family)
MRKPAAGRLIDPRGVAFPHTPWRGEEQGAGGTGGERGPAILETTHGMPHHDALTTLLAQVRTGDDHAEQALISLVYPELRRLAAHFLRRERPDHTLQPTALAHEAYLRICGGRTLDVESRAHFFGIVARQMRQILVDHARARAAQKRSAGPLTVTLGSGEGLGQPRTEDLLAINEALDQLESVDARASRVVELRFFGGLKESEVATALQVSLATVKRDWSFAKAWLFKRLSSAHA